MGILNRSSFIRNVDFKLKVKRVNANTYKDREKYTYSSLEMNKGKRLRGRNRRGTSTFELWGVGVAGGKGFANHRKIPKWPTHTPPIPIYENSNATLE